MTSRRPTDHFDPPDLPTVRDLDRLVCSLRSVGREEGLPNPIVERYETWIFVFLSWGLQAPPHTVSQDRIGQYWKALNQKGVEKWKVAEALDALGFLFGRLGGLEELSFLGETSPETAVDSRAPSGAADNAGDAGRRAGFSGDTDRPLAQTPNPTLRASDVETDPSDETSTEDLSTYLPDGTLPEGIDARAEVPTRAVDKGSLERPGPGSEPSFARATAAEAASRTNRRDTPTTLFNPNGIRPAPGDGGTSEAGGTAPGEPGETNASAESLPDTSRPNGTPVQKNDDSERASTAPEAPRNDQAQDKLWSLQGPAPPHRTDGRSQTAGTSSKQRTEEKESLEIPAPVAERLKTAAHQVGLPPAVFAARAIDLVCEDAGIERSEEASGKAPLEQYQAQLDLLHLKHEDAEHPDGETTEPVQKDGSACDDHASEENDSTTLHHSGDTRTHDSSTRAELPNLLPSLDTIHDGNDLPGGDGRVGTPPVLDL